MRNFLYLFGQEVPHTKLIRPMLLVVLAKMKEVIIPSVQLHYDYCTARGFEVCLLSLSHSTNLFHCHRINVQGNLG